MSKGVATDFVELSSSEEQQIFAHLTSVLSGSTKSPQGEQFPARRVHSSSGEQDQMTHTTRKRKNFNLGVMETYDSFCKDMVLCDQPYRVPVVCEEPVKRSRKVGFPKYYSHDLFPYVPNGLRLPLPHPSTHSVSFKINASDLCLEPQFGVESLLASKGCDLTDSVMSWCEDLLALYTALRDTTTVKQFIAICTLFIKRHMSGSIMKASIEYLQEIVSEFVPQSSGELEWFETFKMLRSNWDLVLKSEAFGKISKLISMAVSIGLCKLSDVQFSIAGVKAFSFSVKDKHCGAIDFATCLFDTIAFFVEGGIQCFKVRSLKPLLLGDTALQQYESDFMECLECYELSRAGNLETHKNMTENDYEKLLSDTIETCDNYCRATNVGPEKTLLLRQREKLLNCATQFRQTRLAGGLRVAPYAIGVFGPSGVGKSSVAQILMTTGLQANGFSAADDRVATLNEADKFMSNYRTYIEGVYIDDLGNTKSEYVEKSPAQKIIEIVNNVRAYANMAEADMKGKVSIEPKFVLITRNVKEKFAHDYSNEPASILRREKITLTVEVKPEFATNGMLDQDKVYAHYNGEIPVIPDLWKIDVERAFPRKSSVKGATDNVGWEFAKIGDKELQGVSIYEVIRYVTKNSREHFTHQTSLVSRMKNMAEKMPACDKCHLPVQMCKCQLEPHVGLNDAMNFCKSVADESVDTIAYKYNQLREIDTQWVTLLNCMPEWLYRSFVGKLYVDYSFRREYSEHVRSVKTKSSIAATIVLLCGFFHAKILLCLLAILFAAVRSCLRYRESLIEEISSSRASVPLIFKNFRDAQAKTVTKACAAMVGVYALIKAYRLWRCVNPHGSLDPKSMEDIEARDAEVNPWAGVEITPLHTSGKSKCITHDHLVHLASKNLCHMSYVYQGKRVFCDAFFPCSNVVLVPRHIWKADELEVTFARKGNLVIGGYFKALLSKSFTVDIPNTDLCVSWVANGGSWKDLSGYLPLGNAVRCPASVIFKAEDGSVERSQTLVNPGLVRASHMSYYGLNYTLNKPTFTGLCMAPIISQTRAPAIVGFHLAGKTGTTIGAGGTLTQQQLLNAIDQLKLIDGVLCSASSGDMPTARYDCQFFESPTIHENSPVRYLPKGANMECYGSVKGRSRHFSEVVQTPISDTVERVCGVPNQWGKPKFHLGHAWQASLQHSSKPSPGMPGNYLKLAVSDYKKELFEKFDTVPEILQQTKPLTRMQTVCGIDGRRFVDKMPGNTSMGYPLGGPKNDHLTILDPLNYEDFACPTELDEVFWVEAEKIEQFYRDGKRGYPIFKGCLKDEPTKLSKDKVRVFQSAPIELQLLVRKYYLPVARLLSLFPLHSECAVGINAQGPEWEAFTKHITKYGKNRIFAGDYSKYDLRMPAQLVLSAFRILIDIARKCGYSEEDVCIMEGIATEIAYPLMAYNGDLLMLFGSNPSGQNMTVFVNGLVNSLLVRCYLAWKGIVPRVSARSAISFLTYGDDIKGSASPKYSISIKEFSEFLKMYDMVFTMPDKDSELVDLMTDEDADFLKRKNVYVPEIQMHLGALDEQSIFKSLHSVLRSPAVSLKEQCMMNVDGALREWFAHGRAVYEERRSQMTQVAEECNIAHGCPGLNMTFDDRVNAFCEKHNVEPKFGNT